MKEGFKEFMLWLGKIGTIEMPNWVSFCSLVFLIIYIAVKIIG